MLVLLGIDTGRTYTDAVLHDEASGRVLAAAKALTTRHDLAVGIRGAAAAVLEVSGIAPASVALVSLSTTLATNALVEGQGGRVGLVLIGFDEAAAARAGIADTCVATPASGSAAVTMRSGTRVRRWISPLSIGRFPGSKVPSTRSRWPACSRCATPSTRSRSAIGERCGQTGPLTEIALRRDCDGGDGVATIRTERALRAILKRELGRASD